MMHTAVSYLRFLFSLTLLEGRSCAFPSLCADKDTPEATREHLLIGCLTGSSHLLGLLAPLESLSHWVQWQCDLLEMILSPQADI